MSFAINPATASALCNSSRFLATIHRLSNDVLAVAWVRTIEQRRYIVLGSPKKNKGCNFDVVYHIGNDVSKVVTVGIQVKKILRINNVETWIPVSGVLFLSNNGNVTVIYTCQFDSVTGEMTLLSRDVYPYANITG